MIRSPTCQALATASPGARRASYLAAYQFSRALANGIAPVAFTALFVTDPVVPWHEFALLILAGAAKLLLGPRLPAEARRPGGLGAATWA
jgi:hypothetical protein